MDDKFAIHAACRQGQISLVESLLLANPRLVSLRDDDDRLPLHWAASHNHPAIVALLADHRGGFDIDAADGAGWTALMMAASLPDDRAPALVASLLARGAAATRATHAGQTALHFAASKAQRDVVRALLAHGASGRARDARGQTALHRAAAAGAVPVVRLLVAERAAPVDAADADGWTALHHAVAEGCGEAAAELLRAGADAGRKESGGALAVDLAPDAKVRAFVERAMAAAAEGS